MKEKKALRILSDRSNCGTTRACIAMLATKQFPLVLAFERKQTFLPRLRLVYKMTDRGEISLNARFFLQMSSRLEAIPKKGSPHVFVKNVYTSNPSTVGIAKNPGDPRRYIITYANKSGITEKAINKTSSVLEGKNLLIFPRTGALTTITRGGTSSLQLVTMRDPDKNRSFPSHSIISQTAHRTDNSREMTVNVRRNGGVERENEKLLEEPVQRAFRTTVQTLHYDVTGAVSDRIDGIQSSQRMLYLRSAEGQKNYRNLAPQSTIHKNPGTTLPSIISKPQATEENTAGISSVPRKSLGKIQMTQHLPKVHGLQPVTNRPPMLGALPKLGLALTQSKHQHQVGRPHDQSEHTHRSSAHYRQLSDVTLRHIIRVRNEKTIEKTIAIQNGETVMGSSVRKGMMQNGSAVTAAQQNGQGAIDLAALTDNVYRMLESKTKIERERRGMLR